MVKKRKTMKFNGLGFPIILVGAPVKATPYGEGLDINFNKLSEKVFEALIRKPARFSGAEVKFIRHMMELSQNVFADLLGVDRSAVSHWESRDLAATEMKEAAEVYLRIQMVRHLKRSVDNELSYIMPAARKREVGKPIELAAC